MKKINHKNGAFTLFPKTDEDFLELEEMGLFANERGGFEYKTSIVPRTTAIASKTLEATRFENESTKYGNEAHLSLQNGEAKRLSNWLPKNYLDIYDAEVKFIYIDESKSMYFSGTIDLLIKDKEEIAPENLGIYSIFKRLVPVFDGKTGKIENVKKAQLEGYCLATGYKRGGFGFDGEDTPLLLLDFEDFETFESLYDDWINAYNGAVFYEKNNFEITEENPLFMDTLSYFNNYYEKKELEKKVKEKEEIIDPIKEKLKPLFLIKREDGKEVKRGLNFRGNTVYLSKSGSVLTKLSKDFKKLEE